MSLVRRAQLRFLWRARGSMLSALLGMTIGVASVVGVHLLSAQIASRVDEQAQPAGDVDLYLQKSDLNDRDYFELRARWREGEHPEIAALFPLLEGEVTVAGESFLLVGTDPLAGGALRIGRDRHSSSNASSNLAAGSTQLETFLVRDSVFAPDSLREVGALRLAGLPVQVLDYSAPDRVLLADLPTARRVLAAQREASSTGERLSRIGVRLVDSRESWGVISALGALLRNLFPGALAEPVAQDLSGLDASWQQQAAANQDPTQQLLRSVLFNVAALSVLALVVAWLLTYQVACHALGRRSGMFERLQSMGVSRGRLQRLTQTEGLVLGLCATLLGVALGAILANVLLSLALGEQLQFLIGVSGFAWLKALVSGVAVAGLSYWLAARQSLFAVQRGSEVAQLSAPRSGGVGRSVLICVALVALFLWGVVGDSLVGAFACIVVAALFLIIYLPSLARFVWRRTLVPVSSQRGSTLGLLGVRQILVGQELRLGVSALALALATALGISIMVDSFRGAFLQMLDRRLADDVVVEWLEPAQDQQGLESAVAPYVSNRFWRGAVPVSVDGVSGRIEYADNAVKLLARFVPSSDTKNSASTLGSPGQGYEVYINESFARLHKLTAGSRVDVRGDSSLRTVGVAGIFTDFGEVRPRLLGSMALAQELHGAAPLLDLYIRSDQVPALRARLSEQFTTSHVRVRDQRQVRQRSIEIFEQTFAITRALTWLALLVAAVALANALAAHGLQQQGTARQLRVLGVAESLQRRLRLARTSYVALASITLALPLGLVIAALLCLVVNPRAFGWSFSMQLTPAGIGWPIAGGALGGMFAALLGDWLAKGQSLQAVVRSSALVNLWAPIVVLIFLSGCNGGEADGGPTQPATGTPDTETTPSLRVGSILGGDPGGFARATQVIPFEFPRDHGAHIAYRSEWWYLTCPLTEFAAPQGLSGREFGVQFTLFRQALATADNLADGLANSDNVGAEPSDLWRSAQLYMAHAALTDVTAETHFETSRFARGHPALAGVSASPFAVWLEDWRLMEVMEAQKSGVGSAIDVDLRRDPSSQLMPLKLKVHSRHFAVDLELSQIKPLVLQGDRGLSYKGSREASYYYSLPRLAVDGRVESLNGDDAIATKVKGACWLDREWSSSVLAEGLIGWDWFALQFDDATEMMLFQLRAQADEENTQEHIQDHIQEQTISHERRQGKFIGIDGAATTLAPERLDFAPVRYWDDEDGVSWPVEWQVVTPQRNLRVVAALDDQRMRTSVDYWEGLVWVFEGDVRVGQGYLEMTGYSN